MEDGSEDDGITDCKRVGQTGGVTMNIYDVMVIKLGDECVENIITMYAGIAVSIGDGCAFSYECHKWIEAYVDKCVQEKERE